MIAFSVPSWAIEHLNLPNINVGNSEKYIRRIRSDLARFSHEKPKVSIVIPAYNEETNLLKTLSSLSKLTLAENAEIIVVNNGSTDRTQKIINACGVRYVHLAENKQVKGGRRAGLLAARGEFVLQADADTLYPPTWGQDYVLALKDPSITVVYGRHAFIPNADFSRVYLSFHETVGELLYRVRKLHKEHINVHGFNSGFRREDALKHGSYEHTADGSEDGHMAWMLLKIGKAQRLSNVRNCAWTHTRKLAADGGPWKAFKRRIQREGVKWREYLFSDQVV